MEASRSRNLRFGVFELDLHSQELRKDGQPIKLAPQAFRVLELLASRPGELVSREQIQQKVWNDGTFVDFEHGINKTVRQIRAALNDTAETPKYIETLPRRGYRFIADFVGPSETFEAEEDIESIPALASPPLPNSTEQGSHPQAAWKWPLKWVLIGLAVVAALLFATNIGKLRDRFSSAPAAYPIRSVAVLPLENLSGDPSQDFFADGITEELTTDLAKFTTLRVTSHTSVTRYKQNQKSLPEIANELRVDAVLEGAVTRSGERVRITAQLIRAQTDEHLWAETYDRDIRDVLTLEDEVARDIAGGINIELATLQRNGGRGARTVRPEVYDNYLKGRYEWNKRDPASLAQAVELFNKVIEQDPTYAQAYAGLADTYAILGAAGYDLLPVSEAMEKARGAALKAIEIDDTLSEAHSSLAFVTYSHDWNWHESEKEFQRALVLNPSNATAHQWYSEYLCDLSRWPQAIAEAEAAAKLDPNSLIINENLARPYYYSRQMDKAIDYSKKTLALNPTFAISHLRLGRALAAKGSYKEAAGEFQRFSDLAGGSTLAIASLANVHARAGERAMALKLASELKALAARKHVPAYQFAIVSLGMGDADESINWLEAAFQERDDFLLILKTEPLFDGLRADRRFQDLERRIGFEP